MKSFTERILTLVACARTFERALHVLHQRIREQAEREPNNQALQYISSISRPTQLIDYLALNEGTREYHEIIQSIRDEELHFNATTQGINRRSLAYQQRKRHAHSKQHETLEQLRAASLQTQSPGLQTQSPDLMTMAKLKQIPDLERDFIEKYRSLTTTAPTKREITKYISNPAGYQWPEDIRAEREFFRTYEPDDL